MASGLIIDAGGNPQRGFRVNHMWQDPPYPDNEQQRLDALHRLHILDTDPEERFDRLTRLAKKLFEVPVVLVCLVDRHRQWFKSRQGVSVSETPREVAFCAYTILKEDTFVVPDAREDARFRDNPLVTGAPHIRMYAGAPLRAPGGEQVGTLCLIDTCPRQLDDGERRALRDLAACVERELIQAEYEDVIRQLQEQREWVNAILDNLVDAVITIDARGRISEINAAAMNMFGYRRTEILTLPFEALMPVDDGRQYRKFLHDYVRTGEAKILGMTRETWGLKSDGTIFPMEMAVSEVHRRGESYFVGVARDVSQRLRDQAIQRKYAASLEKLHRITAGANPLPEKVDQLLQLGSQVFGMPLAIVSHIQGECYTVEYVASAGGSPVPGTLYDLGDTYCMHTLKADAPLAFSHVAESDIRDHPCYAKFGLEAYIGAPLTVDGIRYGTLNFSDAKPRLEPFQETDYYLIQLFAQWIGNEISQHRATAALHTETTRLQTILDSAPYAIFFTGLEGTVRSLNHCAESMLGYCQADIVDRMNLASVLSAATSHTQASTVEGHRDTLVVKRFEVLAAAARQGDSSEREWLFIRADGSRLPVLLSVSAVREAGSVVDGFVVVARDISERKRMETIKEEFIATVSHELRTPLTSISGAVGLLRGRVAGELPGEAASLLEITYRNSQRLIYLINDLLDIEKISAGRMQFDMQRVAVNAAIEHALEVNAAYAQKYEVSFSFVPLNGDCCICVDDERLQQILANFLSNAAKFSSPGGSVTVEVTAGDGQVRIDVSDRGVGVPPDFRPYLFHRFAQADASSTKKMSGTGLGLAICKELAEHMDGGVGYKDIPDGGSCFYVTFPQVPCEERITDQRKML